MPGDRSKKAGTAELSTSACLQLRNLSCPPPTFLGINVPAATWTVIRAGNSTAVQTANEAIAMDDPFKPYIEERLMSTQDV